MKNIERMDWKKYLELETLHKVISLDQITTKTVAHGFH